MVQMNLFSEIETHKVVENKFMDTKEVMGGRMNWDIGIHIYMLLCIK